jgi:hypothetical protein
MRLVLLWMGLVSGGWLDSWVSGGSESAGEGSCDTELGKLWEAEKVWDRSMRKPETTSKLATLATSRLKDEADSCKIVAELSEFVPVSVIMANHSALKAKGLVFVMGNGQNEGILLPFQAGCLKTIADVAAKEFRAPLLDQRLAKRLYSPIGLSVTTDAHVEDSFRLLHVLLDQEVWLWPGVAVGHEWYVAGSLLRTLSLSPKVILVHNILTEAECDEAIESGSGRMFASPERHADPDNPFVNYRTSQTAMMGGNAVGDEVRKRSQEISRTAHVSHVETTQLLKYEPGQWYKRHTDFFDHYKWQPLGHEDLKLDEWAEWAKKAVDEGECS